MTALRPPHRHFATEGATVACMATFPARYAMLDPVVASIAPQVDRLFVYANKTTDGLPDLTRHRNVVVLDGREHAGDLSANGKVYPLCFLRDCFVLTVDDDFVYPPDYTTRMHQIVEACQRRCCVAVHGSVIPPSVQWYYERAATFISHRSLGATQLVNLAGSGTFAFHQSTLRCAFEDFMDRVMVDLRFSLMAREQGLPIWCPARPEGWLTALDGEGLWQEMRRSLTHHTVEARRHDWSFDVYRAIAIAALSGIDDTARATLGLDPGLERALETGSPPAPWRANLRTFGRRTEYLRLLAAS